MLAHPFDRCIQKRAIQKATIHNETVPVVTQDEAEVRIVIVSLELEEVGRHLPNVGDGGWGRYAILVRTGETEDRVATEIQRLQPPQLPLKVRQLHSRVVYDGSVGRKRQV